MRAWEGVGVGAGVDVVGVWAWARKGPGDGIPRGKRSTATAEQSEDDGGGGPMFEAFRRDPGPRFLLAQLVGAMGVFSLLRRLHLATWLLFPS